MVLAESSANLLGVLQVLADRARVAHDGRGLVGPELQVRMKGVEKRFVFR